MKRTFILSLTLLLAACLPLGAQGSLQERVYLSTDRSVYVAGDAVWLSAFCADAATGALSPVSKTAYVELHSREGMVHTAKIALDGGRGAGRLILPGTLPTGNYRIFAYTALGASGAGFDPLPGSRVLSIFNTLSNARVPEGVDVVAQAPRGAQPAAAGALRISAPGAPPSGQALLQLTNDGATPLTFSLSVRHDDGIPAPEGPGISEFVSALRQLPAQAPSGAIPEYEGEILRARVSGTDAAGLRALRDRYSFISAPGSGENTYTEAIGADGTVTFYTSNIYGDQELFLEIEGDGSGPVCHLELVSPFRDLSAGEIPRLALAPGYASALELRGFGMQLEKNFDADTLYTALPARMHRLFDDSGRKSYILDDYTRFPVMEELFVEFIPEIRIGRTGERREIRIRHIDPQGRVSFPQGSALVLLDGVPVLDQEKILSYDPLLVRRIDVYPDTYFFGIRSFTGVVNFVTYKGTLPSMQFADNVRIVEFQGCSYPLAYTCAGVGRDYPDYRQTLYWHPLLTLAPGQTLEVPCKTPAYSGRFEVVAEGLDADGQAVAAHATLDVR